MQKSSCWIFRFVIFSVWAVSGAIQFWLLTLWDWRIMMVHSTEKETADTRMCDAVQWVQLKVEPARAYSPGPLASCVFAWCFHFCSWIPREWKNLLAHIIRVAIWVWCTFSLSEIKMSIYFLHRKMWPVSCFCRNMPVPCTFLLSYSYHHILSLLKSGSKMKSFQLHLT